VTDIALAEREVGLPSQHSVLTMENILEPLATVVNGELSARIASLIGERESSLRNS
jgi:hypothetical protein